MVLPLSTIATSGVYAVLQGLVGGPQRRIIAPRGFRNRHFTTGGKRMSDVHTLEARLSALERQNRLFKKLGTAAVLVALAVVVMGQATPKKEPTDKRVVEAEEFRLVDKEGNRRGVWSTFMDSTSLHIFDKDGKDRAYLSSGRWGTSMVLSARNRRACGVWWVDDCGAKLYQRDENGNYRWKLWLASGGSGLSIYDNDGDIGASLGAYNSNGNRLSLYDKSEIIRAALGRTSLATTKTGVTGDWSKYADDAKDRTRKLTAQSSLVLFDKDAKVIHQVP